MVAQEEVAPLAGLPAVMPFEECPHCFGPVVLTKHPFSAVVQCWDCNEFLAKWNRGMTTWRIFAPDSYDADIAAAQNSVDRLLGHDSEGNPIAG